jgi:hypothetical protein
LQSLRIFVHDLLAKHANFRTQHLAKHANFRTQHLAKHANFRTQHLAKHANFRTQHLAKHANFSTQHLAKHANFRTQHLAKHANFRTQHLAKFANFWKELYAKFSQVLQRIYSVDVPLKQCPAVSTILSLMSDPPQKGWRVRASTSATSHGNSLLDAVSPPTILSAFGFPPQSIQVTRKPSIRFAFKLFHE